MDLTVCTANRLSRRQLLRAGAATVAGAALVGAAGCGTSAGSRRGDTLTMWSWSGADVLHAGFRAVQRAYPAEFKNVSLSTQIMAGGDQSVAQQLTLQLAAHEPLPDIVMLDYLEVPELAAAGVLADLSGILDPVADDLYDGAHAVTSYQGRKIAAP
jgi:multiple sugar transport system substrate-binding protein